MKKILIGICGIGNGHLNRQICVIKQLLKNNYQLLIATDNENVDKLKKLFPKVKIISLIIPWIVCDKDGLNFKETLSKYNNIDLFKKFLEFGIDIEKNLNGKPDLIISDYEPNVAQYAYAENIPLITMEQQSKFIYLDEISLKNHSIKEEINRLNYFFPKFDKKIISSFFPIKIKDKNVIQVPPIITKLEKKRTDNNYILVYFSSYSDSKKYDKLINVISKFDNINFKVYTKNYEEYINKYKYINIEFSNFNDNFKTDLSKSSALITTGGHQLISEAISLLIPLYVIPLDTYEQNYNAYMVNYYGLGSTERISKKSISNFICNRQKYKNNIKEFKKKYYTKTWEKIFIDTIEKILN